MSEKKLNRDPLIFLFVTADKFPPFRVDVSVLFADEMRRRGHQIDWILQSDEGCNKSYEIDWEGGHAWVARTDNGEGRTNRLKKHIFNFLNTMLVFKLLKHKKYDFVQVKDQFLGALVVLLAAWITRTRYIYWLSYPFAEASIYAAREGTARYPVFYYVRGLFFKFLLYKIIMPFADHVFVQSEQMKSDVISEGVDPEKLTPVPMGVSNGLLNESVYKGFQDKQRKKNRIVYLGTLIRERRIDFLVRVLSLVQKKCKDVSLLLVGAGEDKSDEELIWREARGLKLSSNIEITGFLPQKEALQIVKSATVCVSPFFPTPILNSTSPTKVIEYMALGMPVVANDHPEQKAVIEKSKGGICVSYDENEFADAILHVFENPEEAEAMGVSGRNFVKNYRTYSRIADSVESTYFCILNR